ncbi:hypothetical protein REIS_1540 [Rickettsia endosymbiont of Ixodes scapularis]|nr:hypothetical protein REIS_1540 [Rickettsia endosymbiont of Ixodes scapularis]
MQDLENWQDEFKIFCYAKKREFRIKMPKLWLMNML